MPSIEEVWDLALEQLEKMNISEFDVSYHPVLYLILREKFGIPMKDSMIKLLQVAERLDYRHVAKYKFQNMDSVTEVTKKVKGRLPNLIRMEAIVRDPETVVDYKKNLVKIRKELNGKYKNKR